MRIKRSLESTKKWKVQDYIWRVLNIGAPDSSDNYLVYEGDKYIVTRYLQSLYFIIQEDILSISNFINNYIQHVYSSTFSKWEFSNYAVYIFSGLFIFWLFFKILQACGHKKKIKSGDCREISQHLDTTITWNHVLWKGASLVVFVALLISIPWEYVRLYQIEVAKRASAIQVVSSSLIYSNINTHK